MQSFLSLFLLGLTVSCQAAVITVPPVSVTVPLFTTATFTCEGTGDIFNWLVQSAILTDSIAQQRQITVTTTNVGNTSFSSVLTVNAIPINDNLGIGCEVITFNPFNRVIANSNLTIRGVSSVENLQYNFTSNNSLLLTWSLPAHYFDVTIDSPVSYQVSVIDKEDEDIILAETIANTNITVANVTDCDTFNISVTALVDQYTSIDKTISNNGNYSIAEYDAQPLIPSISFELDCPPSKCLVSLMDGNTEVTDIINETEHIIEFKLSPFRHYELTTVVKNLRGKTRATYNTSISTFHTQDIIISSSYTNGSVSVQCVFVSGSTADGCHVIFTDTSNVTVLNVSLSLNQEPTLVPLPAGNYTVTAYDIINGSFYGPAVYYPTPIEVIKMPPTSSSSTHKSISLTASSEFILTPTSSITIPTLVTETTSTTTSKTINDNNSIVPVVAGTITGSVLLILIISACIGITVYKRKKIKRVFIRSEFATIQLPQAETNQYQDAQELRNEAVQMTYSRPINDEDPYHVTRSEFLTVNNRTISSHNLEELMIQEQRPSLISMTTQETTLEDISSTTLNDFHNNAYTDDYDINTPVQAVTCTTTNDEIVQPKASLATSESNFANDRKGGPTIDESPMNGEEISPIQFQETNISFEKSLQVDSPFKEAEIFYDEHIFDHISDEMVGVKPRPVVFNNKKKAGTLVIEVAEVITTSHEVQTSKMSTRHKERIFNHEVPEVIPSTCN